MTPRTRPTTRRWCSRTRRRPRSTCSATTPTSTAARRRSPPSPSPTTARWTTPPTATRGVLEAAAAPAINVLANDTDIDGGPKTIASVTQPDNGTVVKAADGSELSYTPDANYCNSNASGDPDSFTYTLNGGSTATVSVTVTCVDDAPDAANDTKVVLEDAAATAINVLGNDTDIDGGPKTIASVTQPDNGTVDNAADGHEGGARGRGGARDQRARQRHRHRRRPEDDRLRHPARQRHGGQGRRRLRAPLHAGCHRAPHPRRGR